MAAPTPDAKQSRAPAKKPLRLKRDANRLPAVVRIGQRRTPLEDFYHWILTRTWLQFFAVVGGVFVLLNTLFALAYMAFPGAIANLPAGSFEDAFYFSVQTLATIGYGVMSPATRAGHLLVAFEAVTGMVCVALMTGITFAKFARPTARVMFADKMVVTPRGGVPHLMLRMANWRGNQMIDAQLKLFLLLTETTPEGETMRIPVDLKLVRERTNLFILTWMPMHLIDESSPLYGPDAMERLRAKRCEIYVSLTGYDETIAQTVNARCSYSLDDIVWNVRFADMMSVREDGTRELDYHNFHEVVPIEAAPPVSGARAVAGAERKAQQAAPEPERKSG